MKMFLPNDKKRFKLQALFLIAIIILITTLLGVFMIDEFSNISQGLENINYSIEHKALQYIPSYVQRIWRENNYFVVFGIPSQDLRERQWRRYLQRKTCWKYSGVATRFNNFTGEMLILYILGRHSIHDYKFSPEMIEEALMFYDIITLLLDEGKSRSVKYKSLAMEVGMSFKTYLWYQLALHLFPTTNYIVKADDDIFLRVPQYLADLHTLPREKLYWGRVLVTKKKRGKLNITFPFVAGYCATTSRDVVERLVSYAPLKKLVSTSYNTSLISEYLDLMMDHEDMMVGLVLTLLHFPLILVEEKICRFHYISEGTYKESVVIHHVLREHYYLFKKKFKENVSTPVKFKPIRAPGGFTGESTIGFLC